MPFTILRRLLNRMEGAGQGTVTKATASEAWEFIQQLAANDELVTIKDPSGQQIDWVQLRALANEESAPPKGYPDEIVS